MVDPLLLKRKGKTSKEARFGDTLSITIEVDQGNMGQVASSKQEQMGGMVGFFAQSQCVQADSEEGEDEYAEEYADVVPADIAGQLPS
jgi:hypothetical protein